MKSLLLISVSLLASLNPGPGTHRLSITLSGLASERGNVHLALYRQNDPFPSVHKSYKNKIQQAANRTVLFEDIPPGTYALAVFHDENKNGVLDKNIFGVPQEVYGFSNNARGTFSPPGFRDAAFELHAHRKISITLK